MILNSNYFELHTERSAVRDATDQDPDQDQDLGLPQLLLHPYHHPRLIREDREEENDRRMGMRLIKRKDSYRKIGRKKI